MDKPKSEKSFNSDSADDDQDLFILAFNAVFAKKNFLVFLIQIPLSYILVEGGLFIYHSLLDKSSVLDTLVSKLIIAGESAWPFLPTTNNIWGFYPIEWISTFAIGFYNLNCWISVLLPALSPMIIIGFLFITVLPNTAKSFENRPMQQRGTKAKVISGFLFLVLVSFQIYLAVISVQWHWVHNNALLPVLMGTIILGGTASIVTLIVLASFGIISLNRLQNKENKYLMLWLTSLTTFFSTCLLLYCYFYPESGGEIISYSIVYWSIVAYCYIVICSFCIGIIRKISHYLNPYRHYFVDRFY